MLVLSEWNNFEYPQVAHNAIRSPEGKREAIAFNISPRV
jgi:hypothetical protein